MKYGKYVAYGIGGLFLIGVLGIVTKLVMFPINTANTVLTAANGVVSKTLNADNIIASYEWFYDVNAQYISRVGQIDAHNIVLKIAATGDTAERSRLQIERSAMQQSCRDLVTKYNANASKMNKAMFKSGELPSSLNINRCE
jgi:hypothetical protein